MLLREVNVILSVQFLFAMSQPWILSIYEYNGLSICTCEISTIIWIQFKYLRTLDFYLCGRSQRVIGVVNGGLVVGILGSFGLLVVIINSYKIPSLLQLEVGCSSFDEMLMMLF